MKSYKIKSKLKKSKGFPVTDKRFKEANQIADVKEKKKYPKGYKKLKKLENKIPKDEILGHNTRKGKVTVSKKVPKKLRREVAYHEEIENKVLKKNKIDKIYNGMNVMFEHILQIEHTIGALLSFGTKTIKIIKKKKKEQENE